MNAPDRLEHSARSEAGVRRGTGYDRKEWFSILDAWGAPGRPYREIADYLTGHHGITRWWAQKLIVEYEQARGLREPGVRRDGTFEVTASKSIGAPPSRVLAAFTDLELREAWLPGQVVRERGSQPGRAIRFDWADGEGRISVTADASSSGGTTLAIEHERLPDPATADAMKVFWRERLAALKRLLEGGGR